jgi:drug/metabolite transporter (DMT)-like permease
MKRNHLYPLFLAILAALLFGVSAPLAKLLLGEIKPVMLAAFLYFGSGFGLLAIKGFQRFTRSQTDHEARITRADIKWLAGATLAGGVTAPIVLMFCLRNTPAVTASLLLNFEGVATTIIAALIFKEGVSHRAWGAITTITLASILLSVNINSEWGFSFAAFGIILACFLWGIDNNLTRNISAKDPITIVTIKGLVAGTISLTLAILVGNRLPDWKILLGAMLLGSVSYGLSITLFIRAMRGLGAARTSALFGTAPLAGLLFSILLFKEPIGFLFLLSIPLMVVGTMFLIYEKHDHYHIHEATIHDHSHNHTDGHHNHQHNDYVNSSISHSHLHEHQQLEHKHNHMPDINHRHPHSNRT